MKICENRQPLVIFNLSLHFCYTTSILQQIRQQLPLLPQIGKLATLADLLPCLAVLLPGLAVLLLGLVDLLSKY